jgi:major membrane immunogen (membrane-anchored lipoprotein)
MILIITMSSLSCRAPEPETKPPEQGDEQGEDYQDGIYTAEEAEFDDRGWKPMITVIVRDQKIIGAHYDEINKENNLKSFDQEYLENWKEKSGTNLVTAEEQLVKSLVDKQDPQQLDAISGATSTTDKFKSLATRALESDPQLSGKDGYYDGLFKSEGDFDERGWKPKAAVIVSDGDITNAYYDEVNKDTGKYKSYDEQYLGQWKEKSGQNLETARPVLIDSLIDQQDPEKVDAVSGATSTSNKFKELAVKALDPL